MVKFVVSSYVKDFIYALNDRKLFGSSCNVILAKTRFYVLVENKLKRVKVQI